VRLFEIGRIFSISKPGELPDEKLALGLVATGGALEENKAQAERELDFFDLKGALEAAVDWMNMSSLTFIPTSARHLRAGQSALIKSADGKRSVRSADSRKRCCVVQVSSAGLRVGVGSWFVAEWTGDR
jgi:phenylalanyl-tRNA synthetase beta subunit